MSQLPPLISLLLLIGMAAAFGWAMAEVVRRRSRRGSHPRYVASSVERATRYPAAAYLASSALLGFLFGPLWLGVLDCLGVAVMLAVLSHRKAREDDDDDFWTDVKKRVQNWSRDPATGSGLA